MRPGMATGLLWLRLALKEIECEGWALLWPGRVGELGRGAWR